jgi:hypothetical protein
LIGGGIDKIDSTAQTQINNHPLLPNLTFIEGDSPVRIERISANGERYTPHLFSDGRFRVANPSLGKTKHHAANQISIDGNEIISYLRKGYLLRMRGEVSGQVNLIAASEIRWIS